VLIDPRSQVPIFQQIAGHLRKQIDSGIYQAGEALPSLRALAIEIAVNPNTVQRAYELLERERLVESRRGVGVFVAAVDRRRQNRVEKRLAKELTTTIRAAVDEGVPPDRVRTVFESVLLQFVMETGSK
jgi:GntR family transcriptional regulator